MYQRRQQESYERCGFAGEMKRRDAGMVDMSKEEIMHGTIPVAGVLVPRHTIPPVAVEASVGETGEFGEDVEDAFPYL